ncbi:MAG: DUF3795 domain-containing protein [bacterium]
MELSVCGSNCKTCPYFQQTICKGCHFIEGKVFWAKTVSAEICPIYDCVVNKYKYAHCGFCDALPCNLWKDLKDPSLSDEEHEQSIDSRVGKLKSLVEKIEN